MLVSKNQINEFFLLDGDGPGGPRYLRSQKIMAGCVCELSRKGKKIET